MDEMKRFLKMQSDPERSLGSVSKAIADVDSGFKKALQNAGGGLALDAVSNKILDTLREDGIGNCSVSSFREAALAANSIGQAQVEGLLYPRVDTLNTIAGFQDDALLLHRMPVEREVERLVDELRRAHRPELEWMSRADATASLVQDMKALEAPWIMEAHEAASVANFAGIHRVAELAGSLDPFGDYVAEELRKTLGDWRSIDTSDVTNLVSALDREQHYQKFGFALDLSTFPLEAIDQIFARMGLGYGEVHPPKYHVGTQAEIPWRSDSNSSGSDEPDALEYESDLFEGDEPASQSQRNTMFHSLCLFEAHLRDFVVDRMRRTYGEKWAETVIDNKMRKNWEGRRSAGLVAGRPEADLIAFIQFADYRRIVGIEGLYVAVFEPVFSNRGSLEESLKQLELVRNEIVHSRPLRQSDYLVWRAHTMRIRSVLIKSGYPPPDV